MVNRCSSQKSIDSHETSHKVSNINRVLTHYFFLVSFALRLADRASSIVKFIGCINDTIFFFCKMNQTFKTMTFSTLQSYVVWPNRIRSYSVPHDENTIENSWILKANENILYFRCLENTVINSRLGLSSCVHGKKVLRTSVSNDHLRNECQKCQLKKNK